MVFDIITMLEDYNNPDIISISVKPLFQYNYTYLDYRDTKFISKKSESINYTIPDNTHYVVATPSNVSPVRYEQSWKFFLKDISFSSTLANEQELNPMNMDYSVLDDDGYFFTQYDYKYNGFQSPLASESSSITLSDVSLGFSVLSLLPIDGASTAFGLLSLLFNCIAEGQEMQRIQDRSNLYSTSVSNGSITAKNLYSTREDQIANYYYPNGGSCLIKNVICAMHGNDNTNNVWFGKDDDVTAYCKISHTQKLHTRLAREIGLTVVDYSGNEYNKNTCSEYNFYLNQPRYYTADLDKSTKLTLLPNGSNYFSFTAQHTSDYQIVFDDGKDADVFVTLGNSPISVNKDNGVTSCRMLGGNTYKLQIHKATADEFNFVISPSANMPDIPANSEYLIKYTPTVTGAYRLSTDNKGIVISRAYAKSSLYTYANMLGVDRTLSCNSFEAVLKANGIYYLVLKNNTSSSGSCNIQAEECQYTLYLGSNSNRTFVGGENYVYSKFVFDGNNSDISFSFSGVENSNIKVQFIVFDQNGNLVPITEQYYDGFMRLANLSAGTYYVGIRSVENVTLKAKIEAQNVAGKWKRLVNGKWTDIVLNSSGELDVYRGETHYFSYWRGNTIMHNYKPVCSRGDANNQAIEFVDYEYKFIAKDNAFDNVTTDLYAVLRSEAENGNTYFPEKLTIRVWFNVKEINLIMSVDYVNQMYVSFTDNIKTKHSLYYEVKCNSNNGTDLSNVLRIGYTSIKDNSWSYNFLSLLCSKKATKAKLFIKSLKIASGLDNLGERPIDINREYEINCMSKSDSSTAEISNELHLYNLRHLNGNANLANDIYLNYFRVWEPIPVWNYVLNGCFKSIKNQMIINVPDGNRLLFGFVATNNGSINLLTIDNVLMNDISSDTGGEMRFGAIAAINNGTIFFCMASGAIKVDRKPGCVGGIVGINNESGKIHSCLFGVTDGVENVLFNSGDVGGIVGRNFGGELFNAICQNTYVGCYVNKCGYSFGCIAGYSRGGSIKTSTVKNCTMDIRNTKLVSGYYPKMGFVIGHLAGNGVVSKFTITDCTYYYGKLTVGYRKYCYNGTNGCYGYIESGTIN